VSTANIPVSNTLQRLHTLPTSRDSHSARGSGLPIDHYQGDLAGSHYVAFTKISQRSQSPVRFLQFDKHNTSPRGRVTNKTKSKNLCNQPRQSKYCAQTPLMALRRSQLLLWFLWRPIHPSWLHCYPGLSLPK
jgi:hypothetical protein